MVPGAVALRLTRENRAKILDDHPNYVCVVTIASRIRSILKNRVTYPVFLGRKGLYQRLRPRQPPHRHVFVAGVQRSGTNMLMDILERSMRTDVYHERDPRAFDGYLMRELPVIHGLSQGSDAEWFVIKTLCELDQVPAFLDSFHAPRCIWIYRGYRDVANSMLVSFRSVPETVRRMAELGPAVGWWGAGMSAETQALLRRLTARPLSDHSLSALMWYARNVLFLEQGLQDDARATLCRYETLVTRPEDEGQRLCSLLGLPFRTHYVRGITGRSIGRRPSPALDDEVEAYCADLLARLDAHCATEKQAAD